MDADDISSHGRFERQVSFLQKRPKCYVWVLKQSESILTAHRLAPGACLRATLKLTDSMCRCIYSPFRDAEENALSRVGGYRAQVRTGGGL